MSIITAVRNGMGAKTALRIWGEVVIRNGVSGIYPDGFGWPSMSIEARLRKFGHGAKEATALTVDSDGDPILTRPEEAVDRLEVDRAIAAWVQAILKDAPPEQRIYARMKYVNDKCWADIAKQLSEDQETSLSQVGAIAHALQERLRRALRTVLQAA